MFKTIMKITKMFNKQGDKVYAQGEGVLTSLEYKDGDFFIAHCLEFDLVAEGSSLEEAKENLADLIKTQIQFAIEKDIEQTSLFRPAPEKYWKILHDFRSRLARKEFLNHKDISAGAILDRMNSVYAHI